MLKLIVGTMKNIIESAAAIIVFGAAYYGYDYAASRGGDTIDKFLYAGVGFLVGVFAAVIILGVPALLLRINSNLDELNSTTTKILKNYTSRSNDARPHPLAAGFPQREGPVQAGESLPHPLTGGFPKREDGTSRGDA